MNRRDRFKCYAERPGPYGSEPGTNKEIQEFFRRENPNLTKELNSDNVSQERDSRLVDDVEHTTIPKKANLVLGEESEGATKKIGDSYIR